MKKFYLYATYAIIIALLASGCSVQKRLARLLEKHPQPTVIEYLPGEVRDSTIYDTIPGEIVIDSIPVPFAVPADVPDTSISAETTHARATASLIDGKLYLELIQEEITSEATITDIPSTPDTIVIRPPPVIVEVPVKPKIFPFILSAAIIEFLLLIILFLILIKSLKR